jgi:hypothetical protein
MGKIIGFILMSLLGVYLGISLCFFMVGISSGKQARYAGAIGIHCDVVRLHVFFPAKEYGCKFGFWLGEPINEHRH